MVPWGVCKTVKLEVGIKSFTVTVIKFVIPTMKIRLMIIKIPKNEIFLSYGFFNVLFYSLETLPLFRLRHSETYGCVLEDIYFLMCSHLL